MSSSETIKEYLVENDVTFEEHHHGVAYTAQELAHVEHVSGKMVAKVTMAAGVDDAGQYNGELAMLVLPANEKVDFRQVAELIGKKMRLAFESEFDARFPDSDIGAMPPFGRRYGLPVYVERDLAQDEYIVFNAGTHTDTLKIRYVDFERLEHPTVAKFARSSPN